MHERNRVMQYYRRCRVCGSPEFHKLISNNCLVANCALFQNWNGFVISMDSKGKLLCFQCKTVQLSYFQFSTFPELLRWASNLIPKRDEALTNGGCP